MEGQSEQEAVDIIKANMQAVEGQMSSTFFDEGYVMIDGHDLDLRDLKILYSALENILEQIEEVSNQ